MAVEFTEDFESYADTTAMLAGFTAANAAVLDETGVFGSTKCGKVAASSQGYFGNALTLTTYYKVGFDLQITELPASQYSIFSLDRATANGPNDTTTTHGGLKIDSAGVLTVFRADALSTVATSQTLAVDTRYYIEIAYHRDNAGSAIVWVNGVEVLNDSGDYNESTGGAANAMFGRYDSTNGDVFFDNITVQSDATTPFTESEYVAPGGGGGDTITGVGGGTLHLGDGVVLGTGVSRGIGVGG